MWDVFWTKWIEVSPYAAFYIALVMLLQKNHKRHNDQMEKVYENNTQLMRDNYETTYNHLLDLYGSKERKKLKT